MQVVIPTSNEARDCRTKSRYFAKSDILYLRREWICYPM